MSGELARLVGRGLRFVARVVQRPVCRRLLAVVVPSVLLGVEDLIDTDDEAVTVNALAAVDFERTAVGQGVRSLTGSPRRVGQA